MDLSEAQNTPKAFVLDTDAADEYLKLKPIKGDVDPAEERKKHFSLAEKEAQTEEAQPE